MKERYQFVKFQTELQPFEEHHMIAANFDAAYCTWLSLNPYIVVFVAGIFFLNFHMIFLISQKNGCYQKHVGNKSFCSKYSG